eukprot:CAMPEP_0170539598 /NCGR_PEP_ID=MMETSP0209-20121228/104049_1 /TAXON_ID=665100 ORGANISM="Litonotus pictus, Strain P1" /NCGR_SAMPLE_ID=MMETSP0209 /ASSEMBLY_ACC=CAM_ASM_000301 /LENGTH=448 /DNA_ID=CAMNT_0010841603 /DNA_START=170 /DNA_END=1513 /DNA_ORIENTATION=-
MTVYVKGHPQIKDSLIYYIDLGYKPNYISPILNYQYFKTPNSFSLKASRITHHRYGIRESDQDKIINSFLEEEKKENLFGVYSLDSEQKKLVEEKKTDILEEQDSQRKGGVRALFEENEISVGSKFKFNNLEKQVYIENTSQLKDDCELSLRLSYFRNYRDIQRKQTGFTNKIKLTKYLIPRPFVFRDYIYFNEEKKVSLVLSHQLLNNYLDYGSASKQLIAGTPSQDSIKYIGFSYDINNFQHPIIDGGLNVKPKNNLIVDNFKSSVKYVFSNNSSYILTRLFYRKFFYLNQYLIWQTNMEAMNTILTGQTKLLKSHETILVDDFKGVLNPGPKIGTETVGMSNVLKFYNKLYFTNTLLSNENTEKEGKNYPSWNHSFVPFIHCNLLMHYGDNQKIFVTREKNTLSSSTIVPTVKEEGSLKSSEIVEGKKTTENSNIYLSGGFGVTY